MNVRPVYFYAAFIFLAVVFLVVFTDNEPVNNVTSPADSDDKKVSMKTESPSKSNVNESYRRQLEELRRGVEQNPGDTLKMREYAEFLAAAHQNEEAEKLFNRILKRAPRRTDILFQLSVLHYNSQRFDEAEAVTKKILNINSRNDMALYNLGAIAAAQGKVDDARSIWERLIKTMPESQSAGLARSSLQKL